MIKFIKFFFSNEDLSLLLTGRNRLSIFNAVGIISLLVISQIVVSYYYSYNERLIYELHIESIQNVLTFLLVGFFCFKQKVDLLVGFFVLVTYLFLQNIAFLLIPLSLLELYVFDRYLDNKVTIVLSLTLEFLFYAWRLSRLTSFIDQMKQKEY